MPAITVFGNAKGRGHGPLLRPPEFHAWLFSAHCPFLSLQQFSLAK